MSVNQASPPYRPPHPADTDLSLRTDDPDRAGLGHRLLRRHGAAPPAQYAPRRTRGSHDGRPTRLLCPADIPGPRVALAPCSVPPQRWPLEPGLPCTPRFDPFRSGSTPPPSRLPLLPAPPS